VSDNLDGGSDGQAGVCDAFASVLRSGRPQFNAQFSEARRIYPNLDGSAFLEFLRTDVDGLVQVVQQSQPEQITNVTLAAYEAGLELVGQKLVGPGARHPWIETGWKRVLPALASALATAPARIIRSVSNALQHLANTPGARPEQWISEFERLGPLCGNVETVLRVGQVIAWRAGLAHYRGGVITAAGALPTPLALSAIGAPGSAHWPRLQEKLKANPWFNPASPLDGEKESASFPRFVSQAGAFRGFGGLFVEPPRVTSSGNDFLVRSGDDCWLLTADIFGATFHRSSAAEFDSAIQGSQLPPELRVNDSKVLWRKKPIEMPIDGLITSSAANPTTLALTSSLTHSVVLFALS
jgi:hypothetical protein